MTDPSGDLGGGSVDIPTVTEPVADTEFAKSVPAEFKDKPYLTDVKDFPSLFKKLDGAQTLIGQRPAGIPEESASPEDWNKFHGALRPKESSEYDLATKENPSDADKTMDEGVRKLFHENGISKRQAKALETGYGELVGKFTEEYKASQEVQNTDFSKLAAETFGEKADSVLANGKQLLDKYTPDSFREGLNGLPNQALIIMASVLDGIRGEYIKEDNLGGTGGTGAAGVQGGPDDLINEARKLQAHEGYFNSNHPEYPSLRKKVTELYRRAEDTRVSAARK